jgi:hypothetical protein
LSNFLNRNPFYKVPMFLCRLWLLFVPFAFWKSWITFKSIAIFFLVLLYQHHQLLVIRVIIGLSVSIWRKAASLKISRNGFFFKFHNVISVRFQKWISYWFVLVSCFSDIDFLNRCQLYFSPSNNTFLAKLVSRILFCLWNNLTVAKIYQLYQILIPIVPWKINTYTIRFRFWYSFS